MLDGKILVAVLVSLAAISTGMDGGSVDRQEVRQNTKELTSGGMNLDYKKLLSSPGSELRDIFTSKPEPTNDVSAKLLVKDLKSQTINIENSDFTAENFTGFKMDGKTVTSDEKVKLYEFTGSIKPGTVSELSGRADGFLSSGVNVSGIMSIDESMESKRFVFEDVERSSLTFSRVTGEISSANASTEFGSARPLEINSFSGKIVIKPENNSLEINGKVDKLEAGAFSYGG